MTEIAAEGRVEYIAPVLLASENKPHEDEEYQARGQPMRDAQHCTAEGPPRVLIQSGIDNRYGWHGNHLFQDSWPLCHSPKIVVNVGHGRAPGQQEATSSSCSSQANREEEKKVEQHSRHEPSCKTLTLFK